MSVNNPLTWLLKWLNKLRKKQTTTISFRLGVPLIALPVLIAAFAAVFFSLGKTTTPPPEDKIIEKPVEAYVLSRVGTLKMVGEETNVVYFFGFG